MAFCKFCGAEIKDNDKFCTKCGKKTNDNINIRISFDKYNIRGFGDKLYKKFINKNVLLSFLLIVISVFFMIIENRFSLTLMRMYGDRVYLKYHSDVGSDLIFTKGVLLAVYNIIVLHKFKLNFIKTFFVIIMCYIINLLCFCLLYYNFRIDGFNVIYCLPLIVLYSEICCNKNINKGKHVIFTAIICIATNLIPWLLFNAPIRIMFIVYIIIEVILIPVIYFYTKTMMKLSIVKSILFSILAFGVSYIAGIMLACIGDMVFDCIDVVVLFEVLANVVLLIIMMLSSRIIEKNGAY